MNDISTPESCMMKFDDFTGENENYILNDLPVKPRMFLLLFIPQWCVETWPSAGQLCMQKSKQNSINAKKETDGWSENTQITFILTTPGTRTHILLHIRKV